MSQSINVILERGTYDLARTACTSKEPGPAHSEWPTFSQVIMKAARLAQLLDLALTQHSSNVKFDDAAHQLTRDCQQSVQRLLYNLLRKHINNSQLDVYEGIDAVMEPVLHAWELASRHTESSNRLAYAVLRRTAEDPAVFLRGPKPGHAEALLRALFQKLGECPTSARTSTQLHLLLDALLCPSPKTPAFTCWHAVLT